MRETKNQKGITLIALIVTIIVLIIIAGISIATLTSNNGVLNQVNTAKVKQIESNAREQMDLACSALRLAIAEASAKDNSYKAYNNVDKIQDVLLDTVSKDSTGLEATGWKKGTLNNSEATFTITYEGDDYKNACNDDEAKITYTVSLTQKSIEVTDVTTGIKGTDGSDINIDIGAESGNSSGNSNTDEYEKKYYSTVAQAMAVINNSSYDDDSLTTSKFDASVALYLDENNIPNIVFLKDTAIDTTLTPSSNMVIDLGGKTISSSNAAVIDVKGGNTVIKGTTSGSKMVMNSASGETTVVKVSGGSCTLEGGAYETSSNGVGTDAVPNASIYVGGSGALTAENIEITANDSNGGTAVGILVASGGTADISNSEIEVTSLNGLKSDGVRNYGTVTISNSTMVAYSNYTANEAKTDYATATRGISNEGTMTLKNCTVYGTHSGVRTTGTIYIDGGTYEGYGHGGIYFAGSNTTSYAKNAYIGICDMRNGYDDGIAGTNKAGFYVGGGSNITVYMDNCELWGTRYPLVMRVSSTEDNNSLYISNTTLKEGFTDYIRIGTSKNIKIFIGSGNNFNADDHVYYTSNAEVTDVDYSSSFPQY